MNNNEKLINLLMKLTVVKFDKYLKVVMSPANILEYFELINQ